jgi:hypothetical protein
MFPIRRPTFGALLSSDPTWALLQVAVVDRRKSLARQYRDRGGSAEHMGQVERFVTRVGGT